MKIEIFQSKFSTLSFTLYIPFLSLWVDDEILNTRFSLLSFHAKYKSNHHHHPVKLIINQTPFLDLSIMIYLFFFFCSQFIFMWRIKKRFSNLIWLRKLIFFFEKNQFSIIVNIFFLFFLVKYLTLTFVDFSFEESIITNRLARQELSIQISL